MKKQILLIAALLSCNFCFGDDSQRLRVIREGQHSLVNPLLDYEWYEPNGDFSFNAFRKELLVFLNQKIKAGKASHVSVYFRAMNDGPWFGIEQNAVYAPASLLKLPLVISFYKYADTHPEIMQEKIYYEEAFSKWEEQSYPQGKGIIVGSTYTVGDLLERTIIYSDNEAAVLLRAKREAIDRASEAEEKEGFDRVIPIDMDTVSVKSYSSFFRILYNSTYLSRKSSEDLLRVLTGTTFDKGLTRYLPKEVLVAHKFGMRKMPDQIQVHDCGIVYVDSYPYLICVMTRGQDIFVLEDLIAEVSKRVFDEVIQRR